MNTFLIILLVLAMIATVVTLIRGVIAFMKNTEAELNGTGPSASSLRSNKMMQGRIFFQALAVLIVVAIMALAGRT